MLVAAHGVLWSVLVNGEMIVNEMPATLYMQLHRDSEKILKDNAKKVRDQRP
jgi:hypothetical protein